MTHFFSSYEMKQDWTVLSTADAAEQDILPSMLPHWREGGTPYDPTQSLYPFPIYLHEPRESLTRTTSAPSGQITSPPEYEPVRGVLIPFDRGQSSVVRDCVVALTADSQHEEIAYVLVTDGWQEILATHEFQAGGADMSKV